MTKWSRRIMLVTAMLLAGSACGEQRDTGRPYSVDKVRKAFKQETGDELIVKRSARGLPILGDLTDLGVAPELDTKYGDFGIVVFRRLGKRKRAQLDNGERPDRVGIYWHYHAPEEDGDVPVWSAGKWYGNVGLTWYHKTRETNQQWDTLDRALRRLGSD